jgi:hypothetical protein
MCNLPLAARILILHFHCKIFYEKLRLFLCNNQRAPMESDITFWKILLLSFLIVCALFSAEVSSHVVYNNFFSSIVFGGTEDPIFLYSPLPPSEDSLQGSAIPDGSPSKDWQSTIGCGDCWLEPRTAVSRSGVATNEPPLLPNKPPLLPNEPQLLPNEPPLLC